MERFSLARPQGADPSPAIREALAAARRFALAERLDEDRSARLGVVVEEHVANVVHHGGAARIDGAIERADDGAIRLAIADDGAPFDPRAAPPRDRPDPTTGGGSGLALIAAFAAIDDYRSDGGLNRLSLTLAAPPNATCPPASPGPHGKAMLTRDNWRRFIDHPLVEWAIFAVGVLLILISPVLGAIPGPGGVFVFAIGLAMVLKTSRWARRHYVRFKRWQPKAGRWADWGLRRQSARRREQLARERQKAEAEALAVNDPPVDPLPVDPAPGDCAARHGN